MTTGVNVISLIWMNSRGIARILQGFGTSHQVTEQ